MTALNESTPLFETYWQPIVDLQTGTTIAYEALGRINGRNEVDQILTYCRDRSLAYDHSLRRRALETLNLLPPGLKLFINISDMGIQSACLAEQSDPESASLRDERIVWELSEIQWWRIESDRTAKQVFGEYALDDFGAGHADLLRLLTLRPPWLKVSRYIVHDCHTDPRQQWMLRSILELAYDFSAQVIVEGIEQSEEAEVVRRLGIRYAQGFLFGRPKPPAEWL